MIRRAVVVLVVAASVAGCGVSVEDRPRPLDTSSRQRPTIPSVSTRPAPTTEPSTPPSTQSSTHSPTQPSTSPTTTTTQPGPAG